MVMVAPTTRTETALRWGSLDLPSRYLLAPLAGYTNLAFRLAVRELGGLGLATTDLVNARALLLASRKTMELIQTCPEDRPVAVQIYGSVPAEMRDAARWLEDYGVSSVDINMGCPVHKVVRGGGGSALMCDRRQDDRPCAHRRRGGAHPGHREDAPRLGRSRAGAPRSSPASSSRPASPPSPSTAARGPRVSAATSAWTASGPSSRRSSTSRSSATATCARLADADEMLRVTGCAGIAIGRGALLNPWIFAQLRRRDATGEPGPGGSSAQRVDFMHRHFHLLVEHRGERFGCLTFRKVANWYCRVLRPGRDIQQRLVRIESVAEFDGIVEEIRECGKMLRDQECLESGLSIAVPQGPNERW